MNMRKDKTDELFRKKLVNYEWAGDIPDWEEVEVKLLHPSSRVSFWRIAVAAILILGTCGWLTNLFIQPFPSEDLHSQLPVNSVPTEVAPLNSDSEEVLMSSTIYPALLAHCSEPLTSVEEDIHTFSSEVEVSDKDQPVSPGFIAKRNAMPSDQNYSKHDYGRNIYSASQKTRRKSDFSVGVIASNFTFGAKKGNISPVISYAAYRPVQLAIDADGRLRSGFDKNRISGFNHRLPVKVGVSGSFSFFRMLSVETGITYSYHHSDFTRMDGASVKGVQKLHFMGVPVNLICQFAGNDFYRLYAGAGAEINLNLKADQRIEFSGKKIKSDFRQKEPVWGTGIKVGAALRLFRNCEFYFEPALMKYWSKGDLHMRWTDDQLTFNMNFGIRTLF
ncbi:MAG: outer membrane beta-barrel protein [Bacteroidales bacterium]